jgi:prepilin-type N-terminal cleavage/methylation domain-containing protein
MMENISSKAFTLAEILLTLMIVGVISSTVIPAIIADTQQAELKTKFKKSYATAHQAWKLVVAENPNTYTQRGGWTCIWPDGTTADYGASDDRFDTFQAKFVTTKTCTSANKNECWASDAESYVPPVNGSKYFITADGTTFSNYGDTAHFFMDINGLKKPNKYGEDIFSMFFGKDGNIYFACDDKSTYGKPVSSGNVCPYATNPCTVNGRTVNFKKWLY